MFMDMINLMPFYGDLALYEDSEYLQPLLFYLFKTYQRTFFIKTLPQKRVFKENLLSIVL
ncbi:hypothetical protein C8C83_4285 [Flavobacterium sp. 90]|nr:hypothetical protein C8C82_4619 [Flavobacterium sp. 81]TCK56272.1 hypothetical protein C8C83_4285 [Flavobacterium sp. 90]